MFFSRHRRKQLHKSRLARRRSTVRRLPLALEVLEDRVLLSVMPLTLADPSLYGVTGNGASAPPSISADGQLAPNEFPGPNG